MNPSSTQTSSRDDSHSRRRPVLWQLSRHETLPLLLIALLPLLVALPQLLGWLHADPMLYTGSMAKNYVGGFLPGYPYLDPNSGVTSQALGYRAILDWIHGEIPWWNPYSGVGLPLAAEYQPAAFFPLTAVLYFPNGMAWQHLLLQMLAGWGMYGLQRQLSLGRTAATTGGLLYAFNGTLAWLDHAPALPVPFLPFMLWGIERAYAKKALGLPGGWRLFAAGLAMNLLAGFPETAYVNGLLCVAWAGLRCLQTPAAARIKFIACIALGGTIGLMLCAPQILAFFEFLPVAWLGAHNGAFAHAALVPQAVVPSLIVPYAFGPLFALSVNGLPLDAVFGNVGGYVTVVVLMAAGYGLVVRRNALLWLLSAWAVLVLAKSFGLEPIVSFWNFIPGVPETAFFRYAPPTWELCLIILAAHGIDHAVQARDSRDSNQAALLVTLLVLVAATGAASAIYGRFLWPHYAENIALRHSSLAAALWAAFSAVTFAALVAANNARWMGTALPALLVLDSAMMCAIPTLSNPRAGAFDMSAVAFLREHIGLQRFYALGPIQPNYGAYFGVASINHNYLPVARRWVEWIQAHLDRAVDPVNFTGNMPRPAGQPTPEQELRKNLAAYEWAGVKYVVTPANHDPFIDTISSRTEAGGNIPLPLAAGQSATGIVPPSAIDRAATITGVAVEEGNYDNTANGRFKVTICHERDCVDGSADLARSPNNAPFDVPLDTPLQVPANATVRYTFTHVDGTNPVALWAFPTAEATGAQGLTGPAGNLDRYGLRVHLRTLATMENRPQRVYADDIMEIYELADPKPYFETRGGPCALEAAERTRLTVDCRAPATLVRRELYFPGWSAAVNAVDTPIAEHQDLFQSIPLNAGKSDVRYRYAPPHVGWAWLAMWLGLALLLAPAWARLPRRPR